MDQFPLPSLQLYTVFSGLAVFYAVTYGLTASTGFFHTLWNDIWCATAMVNFGCCLYFQLMSALHKIVFGVYHNNEKRHMQDKFWNFVFYKFIFLFGVMNVQDMREMLVWCGWFSLIGCLLLTSQLCKDRFLYLSFSPVTPPSSHAKIIVFLSGLLICCAGLFMVCAIVGWQFGFNHFAFLFSEVYLLFTLNLHTLIRYIIHLWDMHHEGLWENRNTYTYYVEFVLEMTSLSVDFLHHLHMLLWANMFLSVASLILLMKLRFLYQEIQRKMKRHHNYVIVKHTLEKRFEHMGPEQLNNGEEICAICWEKMNTARQLPCGHNFHFGCLRSWLEQDPVCPTCRQSLSSSLHQGASHQGRTERQEATPNNRRNSLLYFNGASIASWLPTFSLEVHQPSSTNASNSQEFHRGVQQVHTMFPHIPLHAITLDLTNTRSVPQTVDNILSGTILIPAQHPPTQHDHTIPSVTHSQYQNGSDNASTINNNTLLTGLTPSDNTEMSETISNDSTIVQNTGLRHRGDRQNMDSEAVHVNNPPNLSINESPNETVTSSLSLDDNSQKKSNAISDLPSLKQRKEQLMENARRNYLTKNPHLKAH